MGYGSYSQENRQTRSASKGYETKTVQEIFVQQEVHNDMNAVDVSMRESRDSDEHPNSVPIIVALDETASMHRVPYELIKTGLPHVMSKIMEIGIPDPQVLFLAIGDHYSDRSPLQVGQFESNDELLDKWLESTYLEGNGGGNGGESYMLAWYFAARHTVTDSYQKRGNKGILVTIGDEPVHGVLEASAIRKITGNGDISEDVTSIALLHEAMEMYEVHHIHVRETYNGRRESVVTGWKELLGDNLHIAETADDIPGVISEIVVFTVESNDKSEGDRDLGESPVKNAPKADDNVDNQEILS